MEFNRNHYFLVGVILLILGIQFRYVESFMLNEQSSRFIAERMKKKAAPAPRGIANLLSTMPTPPSRRTVIPPRWLGWSLISIGAVLTVYCVVMRRPD